MLTQLSSLKSRLSIPDTDTTTDGLLTNAISALSARFDNETNRTLARTVGMVEEFDPRDTEILVACYPIENVTKFELKRTETEGWIEKSEIEFVVRSSCIISLQSRFSIQPLALSLARVTYTGGYVLPGTEPGPGQAPLPADLEQAAVEQLAFWFQNRDRLGLTRLWEYHGTYRQFATLDLLPGVSAVLPRYRRMVI